MNQSNELSALYRRLGYTFNNESLLIEALTHRSVGAHNNERLEFLGDGVLNFVIADALFRSDSAMREGDLSRMRASLVNGEMLADISRELDLGEYIKLGSGELKSGGFRRASILADALESILGAVYCDSDFETCRAMILRLFDDKLNNLPNADTLKDPKTRLQELLQSRRKSLPVYDVVDVKGKAHAQMFTVLCKVKEFDCIARGEGSSRRKAEQLAAEKAFNEISQQIDKRSL